MITAIRKRIVLIILFSAMFGIIGGQQLPDLSFNTKVPNPAYTDKHPRLLIDEAHFNFHTMGKGYRPFADLMSHDGYKVGSNDKKFSSKSLQGVNILVIANALGAEKQRFEGADHPAFTDAECDAVRDWVSGGGSLLLIADHHPFGSANEIMAKRFGVELTKGLVVDRAHADPESNNAGFLVFSADNKLLGDHSIINGRNPSERIKRVITFTGESLRGPEGSSVLLKISNTAVDRIPSANDEQTGAIQPPASSSVSMTGRAQGIAMKFGKGRVVVMGEAAVLTAQVVEGPQAQRSGKSRFLMGMNRTDTDDRQFCLNIVHWLSGLFD